MRSAALQPGHGFPGLLQVLALIALLATTACERRSTGWSIVSGQVTGPEGKPAQQALVAAVPLDGDWSGAATARSDSQGRFRLTVKPGTYGVTATLPGFREAFLANQNASAGQTVTNLLLRLGTGGYRITGRLVDGEGRLAKAGRVAFLRLSYDEGDIFLAHMNSGEFDITLGPGRYLRHALAPGRSTRPEPVEVKGDLLNQRLVLLPEPSRAGREVEAWIKRNAMPMTTVEAGHGFADMQRLKNSIGNARVVSLGEATHGTREFFQLKHRVLEFLVDQMGFTVFAIEANMPEARAVNAYVLEGKGDPAKALAGLGFWTWDTAEVLEMIHWMRSYNEDINHSRKVTFYGFDMQSPSQAYWQVKDYLAAVDPANATWFEAHLAGLQSLARRPANQPTTRTWEVLSAAKELLIRFEANQDAYRKALGAESFIWGQQSARLLAQYAAYSESGGGEPGISPGLAVRDRCMAENVQWILEHEAGAKAVLWAHNAHVSTSQGVALMVFPSMGLHLRETLGRDLVTFGFVFQEGGFRAMGGGRVFSGLTWFEVKPNPKATLAHALSSADLPLMVLDLRSLPSAGPVHEWFNNPQGAFEIGAMFNAQAQDSFVVARRAAEDFDNLIFVQKTSPARRPSPR